MKTSKVTQVLQRRTLDRDPSVPSKHERAIKDAGLYLVTPHDWAAPGKMGILKKGAKLVECNDGWLRVYDASDELLHYRVSPKVADTIMNKKKTIK